MCALCGACLRLGDVIMRPAQVHTARGRFHSLFEWLSRVASTTNSPASTRRAIGGTADGTGSATITAQLQRSVSSFLRGACESEVLRDTAASADADADVEDQDAAGAAARPQQSGATAMTIDPAAGTKPSSVAGTTATPGGSVAAESLIGTRVGAMLNLDQSGFAGERALSLHTQVVRLREEALHLFDGPRRVLTCGNTRGLMRKGGGPSTGASDGGSSRLSHRLELEAPVLPADSARSPASPNGTDGGTSSPLALHFRPATSDSATRLMAAFVLSSVAKPVVAALENPSSVHNQSVCVWLVAFSRPIQSSTVCDADALVYHANGETDDDAANQLPSPPAASEGARVLGLRLPSDVVCVTQLRFYGGALTTLLTPTHFTASSLK